MMLKKKFFYLIINDIVFGTNLKGGVQPDKTNFVIFLSIGLQYKNITGNNI